MVVLLTRGALIKAAIASSLTISSDYMGMIDPGTVDSTKKDDNRGLAFHHDASLQPSLSISSSSTQKQGSIKFKSIRDRPHNSEKDQFASAASFVRKEITRIVREDPAMSGSILRLAFHDATVRSLSSDPTSGGSDGSVRFELEWPENRGLSKPLAVVERVYEMQKLRFSNQLPEESSLSDSDQYAPSPLSFADTLALSGAAVVEASGGPRISILLGRKDVNNADNRFLDRPIGGLSTSDDDRSRVTTSLPSAGLDSLGLRNYFGRLGLSEAELVALSGAHDLGRHVTLLGMPKTCLKNLTRICLEEAPVLFPFVTKDPDTLSNSYFSTLLKWNERKLEYGEASFIPTDVALVVDEGLRKDVVAFSKNEKLFFRTFVSAYQKLVDSTATSRSRY